MATFPALYFKYATKYPQSGTRLELARSYVFTSEAEAPDQRIFSLSLSGMQYFVVGGQLSAAPHPERNMKVLEDFYIEHRLSKSFTLDHPLYGEVVCKFNKPLEIPEGVSGGDGFLPTCEVELLEIP